MKSLHQLLSATFFAAAVGFLATSCETTDNPYVDSIGFSGGLAERRLSQKQYALLDINRQTEAERIRAITLRRQVGDEVATQNRRDAEIASLRQQIASANADLAIARNEVAEAERQADNAQAAIQRRDRAQREVNQLSSKLNLILQTE